MMKTKPFNIEEAKAGAKVVTRDGRNVRILCFDCKAGNEPIIAEIENPVTKTWFIEFFDSDGKQGIDKLKDRDLFLVSEEEEELTEFGYALYDVLCEVEHDDEKSNAYELAKEYSQELLELARKEIEKSHAIVDEEWLSLKLKGCFEKLA